MSRLGEDYRGLLVEHRRMVRESLAAHGGREVDTLGDHQGVVNLLNNLGYLELGQGDLAATRRHLEAGLASAPPPHSRVFLELNLATVILREGDVVGAAAQLVRALTLSHQLGDLTELAACGLDAAACLTATGERSVAAKLHGAADSLREASGALWWPVETELRSHVHARLRAALGDDDFHAAYTAGQHLDVDQTVRLSKDLLSGIAGVSVRV